jgi:alanine or glycine:cation symporter, AGCS family
VNAFLMLINGYLGATLICSLLGVGLYFTWRLGFLQIRHFSHMFSLIKNSRNKSQVGISSFQALCTGLAARVGTGNLAGVAVALTLGGPGAIFWMWVIALIGMATAFAESSLAQLYKVKDHQGNYCGGPAYYMEKGLGKRWLGVLFSLFLIIAYGWVFNAVQTNSIAQAMKLAFGLNPLYVGLFVVVLASATIFGGNRTIARVTEWLVPLMALVYLTLTLWVVITHFAQLPAIITLIFKSAFGWQEAGAGTLGYTMGQALSNGVKRGLFSNEAGMGSAPNTAAAAVPYPPHPASQGYIQMLGVFLDTFVICSATATIILCSGALEHAQGMGGIELTQQAFSAAVGSWGATFVAVALFFFAFTAVIANYSYAEGNLTFLKQHHRGPLTLFRLSVLAMILFGALVEAPLVWTLADISMSLMAITNLVAVVLLSGTAIKLAKDYQAQRQQGRLPLFTTEYYPEIAGKLTLGVWPSAPSSPLSENLEEREIA